MIVRAASLVSALALCLALLPASAAASHIQCGDAITQDTTLDDGIDVDQATLSPPQFHSATVARNKAHHNGDYGVEAVPGVTDGGGNKAHGNGNPLQCLNVSCR